MLRFGPLLFSLVILSAPLSAAPSADLVQRWQKAAVQKFPALAQPGSPMNDRFLAVVAEKKQSDPAFFERADWPMQAAEAAAAILRKEEAAAKEREKAEMARAEEERAKNEEIAAWEAEWESNKAKWVFEKLVFGDTDETILRKLGLSKILTSRVPPGARAALGSRFRWEMGESKFDIDFDNAGGLNAIIFRSLPQSVEDLADFVQEDWKQIREQAIQRYGQPATSVPYPTADKLTRGGLTLTDEWQLPIAHGSLAIAEDGGQARVVLRLGKPGAAPAAK